MDKNILVNPGQQLVRLMEEKGLVPRAAMWVHNNDTETWRLWVVPPKSLTDKHEFYRHVAEIVAANRDTLPALEASDVEMVPDTHPAIKGLSRMFRVGGVTDVHVTNNTFNDFYLPDGIILRMEV